MIEPGAPNRIEPLYTSGQGIFALAPVFCPITFTWCSDACSTWHPQRWAWGS